MDQSRISNLSINSHQSGGSQNIERIISLAGKLNSIQQGLKTEKQQRFEKLASCMEETSQKLDELNEMSHGNFTTTKNELNEIIAKIEAENNKFESIYDQKIQYLSTLEEKVVEKFEEETKYRRETERKAILLIDERYNFLKNEIIKETRNRNESLENFQKIIESDIPKVEELLKEEQNEMVEMDNAISKKLDEETQRLVNEVINERKAREETEEALLEMLKSMINAMKNQLETEKSQRQSTQEYLINLLDDICTKIAKANDLV